MGLIKPGLRLLVPESDRLTSRLYYPIMDESEASKTAADLCGGDIVLPGSRARDVIFVVKRLQGAGLPELS